MAENLQNSMKDIKLQIQKAQQTPSRINTRKISFKHILVKLLYLFSYKFKINISISIKISAWILIVYFEFLEIIEKKLNYNNFETQHMNIVHNFIYLDFL